MTALSRIDEDTINTNLRTRYRKDKIYTYTGTILIAVNPYKELNIYDTVSVSSIYSDRIIEPDRFEQFNVIRTFVNTASLSIPAARTSEIWNLQKKTGKRLKRKKKKKGEGGGGGDWTKHYPILEANTILEAFGNAKTVRNDNSSRFGKFIQVCFDNRFQIKGCIIQDYLLEQSRITFQSAGERNYHIFYQLVAGAQRCAELRDQFAIGPVERYTYLSQSGCLSIDGVDDALMFDSLRLAVSVLNIPQEMVDGIFSVLSAILWLGNLQFQDSEDERSSLTPADEEILMTVATLLGFQPEDLTYVALHRQIIVRGNVTEIPLKYHEVGGAAKWWKYEQGTGETRVEQRALYSRTFAWIVNYINMCTSPGRDSNRFLGVLDIFGFENFEVNSFEQLCINYTNEKLHKFFNHYVFALEQEMYRQEDIQYSHIHFTDNSACLELIEKPPKCILKLLVEECRMPKGTDISFVSKLHQELESHCYYVRGDDRRRWEQEFGIRHYAGAVVYTTQGFLEKNKDVQQDQLFEMMRKSTNAFVKDLVKFQDLLEVTLSRLAAGGTTMTKTMNKSKPTVADAFRHQLTALVELLHSTVPWYVRCIKPNTHKTANNYDNEQVLTQLRYLGMLDIIRIRQQASGYPIHSGIDDFLRRYRCLVRHLVVLPPDPLKGCRLILEKLQMPKIEWQIGKTKVFLRSSVYDPLEEARRKLLREMSLIIQKVWRGWRQRKSTFAREVAAALRQMRQSVGTQVEAKLMRRVEAEMRRKEEEEEERLRVEAERAEAQDAADARDVASAEDLMRCTLIPLCRGMPRTAKEELAAISTLVEKSVLRRIPAGSGGAGEPAPQAECLDLDEMFSFLSEVNDPHAQAQEFVTGITQEVDSIMQEAEAHEACSLASTDLSASTGDLHHMHQEGDVDVAMSPSPVVSPSPPPPPSPSFIPGRRPRSPALATPLAELNGPSMEDPGVRLRRPNQRRQPASQTESEDAERELRYELHFELRIGRWQWRLRKRTWTRNSNSSSRHDRVCGAHFNAHLRDFGGGPMMRTLTRRRKSSGELLPKYEMVTFTRNSAIPTSHVHMYDPENVTIACTIFKDLCKYLRGDGKPEGDVHAIQSIIGYGIEREELRDEIFVQLVRQSTNNPSREACVRAWLLIALCVVSFRPSKAFSKYLYCYLKKSVLEDSEIAAYAQYCLMNLNNTNATNRKMPPSTLEVNAVRLRENLVCRFYFMDGRTKAIDIHPSITAEEAMRTLATKIGLRSLEGWALYESTPDHEHVIKGYEYLADIIYQWETCRRSSATLTKYTTISKRGPTKALGGGECRFVFRKRLFKFVREIPQDPVEVSLLYAQAVHDVVKADSFPVVERVALQLAGLQAQVSVGEPSETEELDRYRDVENYIAERIRDTRPENEWIQALCTAHRTYGSGKSELVCKVWYLSIVMQYPLYGTTLFPVTCRGYLTYDHQLLLGLSCEGVLLVNADTKAILNAYRYSDLESVLVNEDDQVLTVTLSKSVPDLHKCYLFETPQHLEVAALVASYWPPLAARMKPSYDLNYRCRLAFEDRVKLHQEVMNCRRTLVDSGLLNKPEAATLGLFKSTLRKLNRNRMEKLRQEYGSEGYKSYQHTYWAFSKSAIGQSFLVMAEPQVETTACKLFTSILIFSGLLEEEDTEWHGQRDLIQLAQSVMECCMVREVLLNELFVQLIKQTTDHPDPNSRVNVRHWQLLSLACSVAAPTDRRILNYLHAHLRHCAMDVVTEEGQFAQFALKCLMRTLETRGRKWPPSRDEVSCTTRRHPCRARVHFLDGQVQNIDFDPCVLEMVKGRINLRPNAEGYAIYEVIGPTERAMLGEEKLADAMSKWERWSQGQQAASKGSKQQYFLFKASSAQQSHPYKHLLLDAYMDLTDQVEEELLFHQLVYNIRLDRFPVTEQEAVTLCALKAQLDYGDYQEAIVDYRQVHSCLPMRLLKLISADNVVTQHQSLAGMNVQESKRAFLALLQSWPLHKATLFEVTQSYTSSWPKTLWFAVDQTGVHLLELRTRNVLCTCEYESIMNYSPSLNSLMIVTGGGGRKGAKYIFSTSQALQIASLIKDYTNVLQMKRKPTERLRLVPQDIPTRPFPEVAQGPTTPQGPSSTEPSARPVSILYKPPPPVLVGEDFV
ncbi:myosin, putative [Ixodes scapularis]|uniref:Myosin, putative n=1 Tax=Ixodes scapularis TaxID=6945 RepID=B7P0V1_IXOSC|nr:myosin, putative [Ixodes scapularis]|eukprot:XP_002399377.1 myosin, putative [Ixodes scapularis]